MKQITSSKILGLKLNHYLPRRNDVQQLKKSNINKKALRAKFF